VGFDLVGSIKHHSDGARVVAVLGIADEIKQALTASGAAPRNILRASSMIAR
jgi:hypothetical protein